MELLDRYLAVVRRNLPAEEGTDITEELRDVLLARAEEREAAERAANPAAAQAGTSTGCGH